MAYVDATAMAFLFSHNSKKLHHNIHIEKKMSLQEKKKWRRERTCKNGAAMQSGVVEDTFVLIKF